MEREKSLSIILVNLIYKYISRNNTSVVEVCHRERSRVKEHKFIYKGTLPGLNDYLKAERSFNKKHSVGNDMKQQCQMLIINAIRLQLKRTRITGRVFITYDFYEPNKKRDLDNISALAYRKRVV